jgi:hypothetical protein
VERERMLKLCLSWMKFKGLSSTQQNTNHK